MTENDDNDHYYNMSLTRVSDDVVRKLVHDGVVRACETGDGSTRYQFDEHGLGVVIGFNRTHGAHYTDPDGCPCSIKPIDGHQIDETFIDEDSYVLTTWSMRYDYGNFAEIIAEYITYEYASPIRKTMIKLTDLMDSDYLLYYLLPLVQVIILASLGILFSVL